MDRLKLRTRSMSRDVTRAAFAMTSPVACSNALWQCESSMRANDARTTYIYALMRNILRDNEAARRGLRPYFLSSRLSVCYQFVPLEESKRSPSNFGIRGSQWMVLPLFGQPHSST
jgi:hypothetical protein